MAVGIGLALLLAGCGTGQVTQTSRAQSSVNGAQGQVGPMAVRNAQLAVPDGDKPYYQSGSDAPLLLTIVNTGTTEDELTSMTSPSARSVRIEGQRALPAQTTLRSVEPSESKSGTSGTSGAGGAGLQQGEIRVVLEGLGEDVRPGLTVPVTLLFRQAGELTLNVPIAMPEEPRAESTP